MLALTPQIQNNLARAQEHNHPLKNISATEKYETAKIIYDHFAGRISAIYAIDTQWNGKMQSALRNRLEWC